MSDIEALVSDKGVIRCRDAAKELNLRVKDVLYQLKDSSRVYVRPVQWIMGVPFQIVTPDDYFLCATV